VLRIQEVSHLIRKREAETDVNTIQSEVLQQEPILEMIDDILNSSKQLSKIILHPRKQEAIEFTD